MPEQTALQAVPVHLLAAIYATAQPFTRFDEYLCILNIQPTPLTGQLWHIVLDTVLKETNTPHLATLQAGILYLHRQPEASESTTADSGFVWSFLGMLTGLATTLGLQLECRPMGLPAWEKRLRRRLWWAIYAEDKWRGLLMGRPPYIRNDEWDVTGLDDEDFRMSSSSSGCQYQRESVYARPFQQFVRLSCIADDLQHAL